MKSKVENEKGAKEKKDDILVRTSRVYPLPSDNVSEQRHELMRRLINFCRTQWKAFYLHALSNTYPLAIFFFFLFRSAWSPYPSQITGLAHTWRSSQTPTYSPSEINWPLKADCKRCDYINLVTSLDYLIPWLLLRYYVWSHAVC